MFGYNDFYTQIAEHLKSETNHCLAYYLHGTSDRLRLYCCIADDLTGSIKVFCHEHEQGKTSAEINDSGLSAASYI